MINGKRKQVMSRCQQIVTSFLNKVSLLAKIFESQIHFTHVKPVCIRSNDYRQNHR